jgi:hypothetical protein
VTDEHPGLHPALERSRELLEAIEAEHDIDLRCGRCGSEEWGVWRSILGSRRCQNDVMVKCQTCWHVSWHGIPMERAAWEAELDARDGKRSIDAVGDGEGDVHERLRALGYLDSIDEPPHGQNVKYKHGPGSPVKPR